MMENGVTCYKTKQVKLGIKPDELKAGDIIAYHSTVYHSEGFRLLILDRTKTLFKTVVLFSPFEGGHFKVGQNYNFTASEMTVTKWRIV